MFVRSFLLISILSFTFLTDQFAQEPITVEAIWSSGTLTPNGAGSFHFLKDGQHYSRLEGNSIVTYDLLTGKQTERIFSGRSQFRISGYSMSQDESHLLIESDPESIYRRSRRSTFYVWDRKAQTLYPVSKGGKQMHAAFSPDGTQVAFVRENNLYISDYKLDREIQVTFDGKINHIINGASDWVYEEEFRLVRSFEWSPDGTRLAYYRFDESEVPEFTMTLYQDLPYPVSTSFKYPKVGQRNASVSIHVYDLASGATRSLELGPESDQYIPRIKFTSDPSTLCVTRLNRHQDELDLLLFDVNTGNMRILLQEKNDRYLNLHDDLRFLEDGSHFVWTSEKDGWNHIYLYDMKGNLIRQLTSGEWDVTAFYGVDITRREIWFQSAQHSPIQREVCLIDLDGRTIRELPFEPGYHEAQLSSTYDYFVHQETTINSPPRFTVVDRNGSPIRLIEDNQQITEFQKLYGVQPAEYFSFETPDENTLDGWMIKPADFDPAGNYPLFMFVYGGPGRQQVTDKWMGQKYWWFQMLASKGVVIAAVDGRGSGARGENFRKMTHLQLGHYETIDQIHAARYLGGLPFVDADRIGIYGWSYGGYLSSLCILKGRDVFKSAIAVAPVTNWKWYDSIYTERYMRTEEENPDGYKVNSPVYFADQLQGDYLLIHGMADDNVHFQNSAEMARALIQANKQFDSYFYVNHAHSIVGGNARTHLYTKMTDFVLSSLMD